MSAEHGGHGGGGSSEGIFFIEGVAEPSEDVWVSLFDFVTFFISGLLGLLDMPMTAASQG